MAIDDVMLVINDEELDADDAAGWPWGSVEAAE